MAVLQLFILVVIVRPFSVVFFLYFFTFDILFALYRKAGRRSCPLGFPFVLFLDVVLIVCVPFPLGVLVRMWFSIVSVLEYVCLFTCFIICSTDISLRMICLLINCIAQ